MNKFLGKIILTLSLLLSINLFSQVKMGENPNIIDNGSLLELESTNKVLRVTRIQKLGDTSILLGKKSGMVVYIESEKCLFQSDGNSWKSLCENIKSNGKSVTSGSLILVSGNPGAAVLDSIHIDLNIKQLKDSMAKWMSTNPIIDSMMANIIVGNGLTKNPVTNSIELGGVLTKPTSISTNSTNTFALTGLTDGILSNSILVQDPTTGVIRKISSSAFANGMIDSVLKSTKFSDSVVRIVSTNSVIIKNLRDSVVTSRIFKDSVTSIVSKNTEIIKNITDSIEKRIQNGEISGNDLTSGSPTIISVTGGAGATLLDAVVNINMNNLVDSVLRNNKFKDSVVSIVSTNTTIIKNLRDSIVTSKIFKDSVTSIVSKNTEIIKNITDSIEKRIQNGEISGNNLTSTNPNVISITGGAGATLLNAAINVNMKNVTDSVVSSSIFKDSVSSIVSKNTTIINNITDSIEKKIQNGEISGKNMTSGSLVSLTGTPAGSLLQDVKIDIDATKMKDSIASWINDKPISDSISKFVSTDMTIIKSMKDSVFMSSRFTDSIKSIISSNTTILNNITDSIEKRIQNGEISGNDLKSSKGILVTGGNGSTLLDVDLRLDSSAVAKMVTESPVKDSILTTISKNINNSPLKDSIYGSKSFKDSVTNIVSKNTTIINNITDSIEKKIQNGEILGKNMTSGSLVSLTGTPAGSLLQDVKIDIDSKKMKDSIASWINDKPISDSISKFVSTDTTIIKSLKDSIFTSSRFTDSIKSIVSNNTTIINNITDSIEKKIQNGEISGNNLTSTNPNVISITGGAGATLLNAAINVNMKNVTDSVVSSSIFKDSVSSIVSKNTTIINNITDSIEKRIQNGEISGNDLKSSKGILVTGGNGSTLLDVDLRLDSSAVAKMVTESPVKDSILTTISKNINNSPLKDSIYGSKSFKDSVTNIVSKDTTIINNIKDSVLSSQSFKDSLVKVMKDSTTNVLSYNKTTQILTSTVNGKMDTTLISTASKDSTIARNGLTQIKDTVELGGTLIKPTTITTSATNTLSIAGLQSGKKSDSIMTDSAGVVRHRSLTSILTPNWIEITSNYTVQDENIVLFTGSSDATLTLPSAAANPGRVIQILNYAPEGSVVNLTMSPALRDLGSDTGSVLSNQLHYSGGNLGSSGGNTLKIFSNGTSWFKLSN